MQLFGKRGSDAEAGKKAKPDTAAEAVPKLELQQLLRSESQLFPEPDTVQSVAAYGNTTMICDKSDTFKLVDERGNFARDFEKKASRGVTVNFGTVGMAVGKDNLNDVATSTGKIATVSELGAYLSPFASRALDNWRNRRGKLGSAQFSELQNCENRVNSSKVLCCPEKGYILTTNQRSLGDNTPGFVMYVTKREDGSDIDDPRNWKRIDSAMPVVLVRRIAPWLADELLTLERELFNDKEDPNDAVKRTVHGRPARVRPDDVWVIVNDRSKFVDRISGVESNLCEDPQDSKRFYYCQSQSPEAIYQVDMAGEDPSKFPKRALRFPQQYGDVHDLTLHKEGAFFTFRCQQELVIVERDTLQEIGRLPHAQRSHIDDNGLVRTIDDEGHFVLYDTNLQEIIGNIKSRQLAGAFDDLDPASLFASGTETKKRPHAEATGFDVGPIRERFASEFRRQIDRIGTPDDAARVVQAFDTLEQALRKNTKVTVTADQARSVTTGWRGEVKAKQTKLADGAVDTVLTGVRKVLATTGGITPGQVDLVDQQLQQMKQHEGHLSDSVGKQLRDVRLQFESASRDVFIMQEEALVEQIQGVVAEQRKQVDGLKDELDFRKWQDFTLPAARTQLINISRRMPPQCLLASQQLSEAQVQLDELENDCTERFKQQYDKIRSEAKRRRDEIEAMVRRGIDAFIERLVASNFALRSEAEQYVASNPSYHQLQQQIALIGDDNEALGKELHRHLEAKRSSALAKIERFGERKVVEGVGTVERFGAVEFPVWEGAVKEKGKKDVTFTFIDDTATRGPGVGAKDVYGDVGVHIRTSQGKDVDQRLWESRGTDERDLRGGSGQWRGDFIPPSYISRGEYNELLKKFREWKRGGAIRREYDERRKLLQGLYAERQLPPQVRDASDTGWQPGGQKYEEYKGKLAEFGTWCAEHHIALLKRMEAIEDSPEPEYANGKGALVQWQDHWVLDPGHDIPILDEIAERFNVQLKNKSGALMLEGPTGAGKDVYLQMYAERSRRPYFAVDCSKWTTEFELSQDVSIGTEGGVAVTVKEDSAVLQAIQTPGAILYFNEFNALPHPAQIFLHSLLDDKRSLQLKTSGGRVVKAADGVLLAASMNWGYEGTNAPNEATMDRFSAMTIGYPPLRKGGKDTGSYSAAEALRVARCIDTWEDASVEADMGRNAFVAAWNAYVNNEGEKPNLRAEQEFDLKTIFVLVSAADRLRKKYLESASAMPGTADPDAYMVSNPITSRALRRCAARLSTLPLAQKTKHPNREVGVALDLLEKEFLPILQPAEDREKLRQAMRTWTFELAR
jgi:hypothetical protein